MSARLRVPCRQCGTPVDLAGPFHKCPRPVDVTDMAKALGITTSELNRMVARVEVRTR